MQSIYPCELVIKDTCIKESAWFISLIFRYFTNKKRHIIGNLTTTLDDKRDDFNFFIVNISYLCSNKPAYGSFCPSFDFFDSIRKGMPYVWAISKTSQATEKQVDGTIFSIVSIEVTIS